MDSSFKKKELFSKHSKSTLMPFKKGVEKQTITSQKHTSSNIYSNQKKTIKKLPKLHTPCTKLTNSISVTQSCSKMSSNHKKRLNFEQQDVTPKRLCITPNDLFINGFKTSIRGKNEGKMENEDENKSAFHKVKTPLMVRKLDFFVPGQDDIEEDGVYCLKLSKENQGKNRTFIKAEIKIEIEKPENHFFTQKDINSPTFQNNNFSKVTLNTFNSFRLSSQNKLIDMMDTQAQIDLQKQALEEIHKKYAQKDFGNLIKSEEKTREEGGKKVCCNCKKSRCLKLYCECFAAQKFCQECNCLNCANLQANIEEKEKVVTALLSRNPNAFKPKLEYNESTFIANQIAVKHSKGCNCKKTLCSKKYCECYQAGIKCTELCKCEECRNGEHADHSKHNKKIVYYQMKQEMLEANERENIAKLDKNKNLFKSFVGVKNNNKIKMSLFNYFEDKDKFAIKEENRFLRERNSPSSLIQRKY